MTEKQADEEALNRYNDYINSPANQRLLSYRTDSATRHIWTEGDIKRYGVVQKPFDYNFNINKSTLINLGSSKHLRSMVMAPQAIGMASLGICDDLNLLMAV